MAKFAAFDWFTTFFVFLGALNWGLVGIFDFNLVAALFGTGLLTKITYVIFGLSAVYFGFTKFSK